MFQWLKKMGKNERFLMAIMMCFCLTSCKSDCRTVPKNIENRYEKIMTIDLGPTPEVGRIVFDNHHPKIQIIVEEYDHSKNVLVLEFNKIEALPPGESSVVFVKEIYNNAPFIWQLKDRGEKSNTTEHIFVNWAFKQVSRRSHVVLFVEHRAASTVSCAY